MSNTEPKHVEPRLLPAKGVANLLGLGLTTFQRHRSLKLIGPLPIRIGGAVRWDREELKQWIAAGCPGQDEWQRAKRLQSSSTRLPALAKHTEPPRRSEPIPTILPFKPKRR